jgi:hypothetical protein
MASSTATVDEATFVEESELFGSEARLSWVLAGLAGLPRRYRPHSVCRILGNRRRRRRAVEPD